MKNEISRQNLAIPSPAVRQTVGVRAGCKGIPHPYLRPWEEGEKFIGCIMGIFLSLVAYCSAAPSATGRLVHLKTSDGWTLTATYVPGNKQEGVVMIHGLAAGKGEWEPLQKQLAERGIGSIAIDLRGHGGSLGKDNRRDWKTFVDHGPTGEWAQMWKDAEAGVNYLKKQGFKKVGIAGASIGANIALQAAVHLPEARFAALLSPGMDYQGLLLGDSLPEYGIRPLLLVSSAPDGYAYQSAAVARQLRVATRLPVDWIEAKTGHGAQMFGEPDVLKRIADWMSDSFGDK